jgi:hypothetical protein
LCKDCDLTMHPGDMKIKQRHHRVPINLKPLRYDYCEKHPNNYKELFCVKCRNEMCISCKLIGDHSQGELGEHVVWPINECFNNLRESKDNYTPQIKEMKNKLGLASKSISLKEKFNSVESEIKSIAENLQKKLRKFSNMSLEKITNFEFGLKKRLDELIWMDYFLRYQIDSEEPQKVIKNFF